MQIKEQRSKSCPWAHHIVGGLNGKYPKDWTKEIEKKDTSNYGILTWHGHEFEI